MLDSTSTPEAIRTWIRKHDLAIAKLAGRHLGDVTEALTFERCPPLIPQASYKVCTLDLEEFIHDVLAMALTGSSP